MAITLTQQPQFYDMGTRIASVRVDFVLSGSYATGGETVDLTQIPRVHVRDKSKIKVIWFQSANGVYAYNFVFGSNLTNGKIKILTALGTELGAGAYAAGYTSDTPSMFIEYLKD